MENLIHKSLVTQYKDAIELYHQALINRDNWVVDSPYLLRAAGEEVDKDVMKVWNQTYHKLVRDISITGSQCRMLKGNIKMAQRTYSSVINTKSTAGEVMKKKIDDLITDSKLVHPKLLFWVNNLVISTDINDLSSLNTLVQNLTTASELVVPESKNSKMITQAINIINKYILVLSQKDALVVDSEPTVELEAEIDSHPEVSASEGA